MKSTKVAQTLKKLQDEAIDIIKKKIIDETYTISNIEIVGVNINDDLELCLSLSMKIRNITNMSVESLISCGKIVIDGMKYRKSIDDHVCQARFQTYYLCVFSNYEKEEKPKIIKKLSSKPL